MSQWSRALHRGTSARAERTRSAGGSKASRSGYLRSRGEGYAGGGWCRTRYGVPPLARRGPEVYGLTEPQYRGTSVRTERTAASRPVGPAASAGYLRSRGEDEFSEAWEAADPGVPPLARRGPEVYGLTEPQYRGTSVRTERTAASTSARGGVRRHLRRGTSARAERTPKALPPTSPSPGYLRSRGEDRGITPYVILQSGVPPLARRGPRRDHVPGPVRRGTSARAERTPTPATPPSPSPGYLRSRGEDGLAMLTLTMRHGVPPLARRGRDHGRPQSRPRRGTSARAERTAARMPSRVTIAGHLRSRREEVVAVEGGAGASLRVRGRHLLTCNVIAKPAGSHSLASRLSRPLSPEAIPAVARPTSVWPTAPT